MFKDVRQGVVSVFMDIQPKLLASLGTEKEQDLVKSLVFALQAFQSIELPTLVTEQAPDKLGETISPIRDELRGGKVIEKTTFSAFGCDLFCDYLSHHKVDHILLSGIETSICVYLTALDARARDVGVTVITDCIASRRDEDGKYALEELGRAGVHLLGIESVLYSIIGSSEHPKFREVSSLVRGRGS